LTIFSYPICKKWRDDTSSLSGLGALTQATALLIVVANFILRTVFIKLVTFVRYNKESKQANDTMVSVLLVSVFNYGLLYIIAPWNFAEVGASDADFFSGIYTDFTSQWFLDIGSMIATTSALNILSPLIELLVFWCIKVLKRMWD